MHRLGTRDLTEADFQDGEVLPAVLEDLNVLGREYRALKSQKVPKAYDLVRKMKRRLPEGYLQKADVCFNYEVAINMFKQRYNHRLPEWAFNLDTPVGVCSGKAKGSRWTISPETSICNFLYSLPFMPEMLEASGCKMLQNVCT
jgi:hypothetical protein